MASHSGQDDDKQDGPGDSKKKEQDKKPDDADLFGTGLEWLTGDYGGIEGFYSGMVGGGSPSAGPGEEKRKQNFNNWSSNFNNYVLGSSGFIYGLGEFSIKSNTSTIIKGVQNFLGNDFSVANAVTGTSKALKILGKGTFYGGALISGYQGISALSCGDYITASKNGLDIGMGAIATFGGPVGLTIGGIYYIVDNTVGWPVAINGTMQSNKVRLKMIQYNIINYGNKF